MFTPNTLPTLPTVPLQPTLTLDTNDREDECLACDIVHDWANVIAYAAFAQRDMLANVAVVF